MGNSTSLSKELADFFRTDVAQLQIAARRFATVDLPNIQLAIADITQEAGAPTRSVGYVSMMGSFHNNLRSLLSGNPRMGETTIGPVQYRQIDVGTDKPLMCLENGLHLIDINGSKVAAHVRFDEMRGLTEIEVASTIPEAAASFLDQVKRRSLERNVYRGKILAFEGSVEAVARRECATITFCKIPKVAREDIVLPAPTLELIERNTIGFFKHAEILRKSGRSVKRGLLLHGAPGTGKTFTAKWLAQSIEGLTVILVSGEQLWMIKQCCQLAKMLAPALIIMEDVDLIATQRDVNRHPMYEMTLHQLLNEMDGVQDSAEVLFLLTTNRPDAIEPAIASRPGRIDQAIEFPLPDEACRTRLFELYGRGLTMEVGDLPHFVAKTEGASPAFIQELIRKAALIAAEQDSMDGAHLRVDDSHLETALRELLLGGGQLTKNLLGFAAVHDTAD